MYVRGLGTGDAAVEPARLHERLPQWRHRATVILAVAAVCVIREEVALGSQHGVTTRYYALEWQE